MSAQDVRSFIAACGKAHPGEVVRVTGPVSIEHDPSGHDATKRKRR